MVVKDGRTSVQVIPWSDGKARVMQRRGDHPYAVSKMKVGDSLL